MTAASSSGPGIDGTRARRGARRGAPDPPPAIDPGLEQPTTELDPDASVRVVHDHADRLFSWRYQRERPQLVNLYNKAAASQWNSVTDLDWGTDVDPERVVRDEFPALRLARRAATLPGSPMAHFREKEFAQLGVELFKAQLSQFMHGEQGAMITAAKLVETVPWMDAKYYAATQTMDEARHTEVFARYLHEKLGEPYPMAHICRGRSSGCSKTGAGTSPIWACRSSSRAWPWRRSATSCGGRPSPCWPGCCAT